MCKLPRAIKRVTIPGLPCGVVVTPRNSIILYAHTHTHTLSYCHTTNGDALWVPDVRKDSDLFLEKLKVGLRSEKRSVDDLHCDLCVPPYCSPNFTEIS